jgi:LPS-assembly protein
MPKRIFYIFPGETMKIMHTSRFFILLICMVCLTAVSATGEPIKNTNEGLTIKADAMDHNQADDLITATGTVVMQWQDTTITADTATYDRSKKSLQANGHVSIKKGGDTITCDSARIDLESGRGELVQGNVFIMQNNMHITGARISRTGEDDYAAHQGTYTTCDDTIPSWKFAADDLDMTLDQYGTAKHVKFYIKDVPVLYFPYAVFPVKRERQSGFLFPRFGWSGKKGARTDIFYYWAISPSQEATIDLDIQTKQGVGTGLDYRYLRKQGSTGNLGGYLIYDLKKDNLRGFVAQSHREIFSPDMNIRSSINMATDRLFFNDYGEKSGEYNRQSSDSTVNFLKTWQQYALTGNLRYTQDYYAASNKKTLQTLPEIGLTAVRQQLFSTPLYFDMDSTASNFYRESGVRGQRLYGFPRLTLVNELPGHINATLTAGIHMRAYNTENATSTPREKQSDGSMLPEAGVRLSTALSKIYELDGEHLKKLRHEIIPEVSYRILQQQDQSRLPLYDIKDRLPHLNMLQYSLTNILGGKFQNKETSEYRDLARLKLSQWYSFDGYRQDLLNRNDSQRPWSDLLLESEMWLHPQFQATLDGRYNVYDNTVSSTAAGLQFDDKRGSTAGISYQMWRNDVEYMEGRLATKLFLPWAFSYATRYSLDRHNFLESVYSAEYRHQCWSILASYSDRRVTNPSQSIMLSFNLMGAFGFGSSTGGLGGK